MNLNSILVMLLGVFLRLAVPFFVTALVVLVLRKMDSHWQAEAERDRLLLQKDDLLCWKEQGITIDEVKLRASKGEKPCWQLNRLANGTLREGCLDCEVFLSAPVPAPKRVRFI